MALHLQTVHPHIRVSSKTLKLLGEQVLCEEGREKETVSITFVDDRYMQQLNRTYLHKNRSTDVMAFPIDEPGSPVCGSERILGDIYISLDRAREQSVAYGVSFQSEVSRLMLHGLYHLLGYSHNDMAPLVEQHVISSVRTGRT